MRSISLTRTMRQLMAEELQASAHRLKMDIECFKLLPKTLRSKRLRIITKQKKARRLALLKALEALDV